MTISFIGAQGNAGNTVSIPTHQIGDLILIFAYRDGNNTAPTTPAASGTVPTWTLIGSSGGNSNSSNFRWARATATNTTSGTWTNASEMICLVYRKARIGASQGAGAQSTTIAFPALTLQRTDGSSWVVGVAGHRTATNVDTAPPSMTNRAFTGTEAAGHDTNGGVSSWSQETVTASASSGWRSWTVELRDTELDLTATTETFALVGEDVDFAKQVALEVDSGTFALAGTTTGLLKESKLDLTKGDFTVAGVNVGLLQNLRVDTSVGTFALSGQNTDIVLQRRLDGSAGTFLLDGINTILTKDSRLDTSTGTFLLNGINVDLLNNRLLSSTTGSFLLNGINLDLTYIPNVGGYELIGQTGTFTLAGTNTGLLKTFLLTGTTGTYLVTGTTTQLTLSSLLELNALTGTFTVNGIYSEALKRYPLITQPATFQVTGNGIDYFATRTLNAGSLNLSVYVQTRNITYKQNKQPVFPLQVPTKRNQWVFGRFTSMGRRFL